MGSGPWLGLDGIAGGLHMPTLSEEKKTGRLGIEQGLGEGRIGDLDRFCV